MSAVAASAGPLSRLPVLFGRVLPRVHSVVAAPTQPETVYQRPTPPGAVVVRVPYKRFNEHLKTVR